MNLKSIHDHFKLEAFTDNGSIYDQMKPCEIFGSAIIIAQFNLLLIVLKYMLHTLCKLT